MQSNFDTEVSREGISSMALPMKRREHYGLLDYRMDLPCISKKEEHDRRKVVGGGILVLIICRAISLLR